MFDMLLKDAFRKFIWEPIGQMAATLAKYTPFAFDDELVKRFFSDKMFEALWDAMTRDGEVQPQTIVQAVYPPKPQAATARKRR